MKCPCEDYVHVYPLNDLGKHDLVGISCRCNPRLDDGVVIHNSFDGREFIEKELEKIRKDKP